MCAIFRVSYIREDSGREQGGSGPGEGGLFRDVDDVAVFEFVSGAYALAFA